MVLFSDEENGSQFVESQSENNIESQKTATEDAIKQGKNTTYFMIIFNDIKDYPVKYYITSNLNINIDTLLNSKPLSKTNTSKIQDESMIVYNLDV